MSKPGLLRLEPERYGALFHEPGAAGLAIGESACRSDFDIAALAFYAVRQPVLIALFCGTGATHHADLFREHVERYGKKKKPAARALTSHEPVDVDLAAEGLLEAAYFRGAQGAVVGLLDPDHALEAALWAAVMRESARRAAQG